MTTNKFPRILIAAVCIAAAITGIKLYAYYSRQPQAAFTYQCFTAGEGWGYDIMAGDRIIIHQSIDPALAGRRGFNTKAMAEADARNVIGKIKLGETPVFNAPVKQQSGTFPAQ